MRIDYAKGAEMEKRNIRRVVDYDNRLKKTDIFVLCKDDVIVGLLHHSCIVEPRYHIQNVSFLNAMKPITVYDVKINKCKFLTRSIERAVRKYCEKRLLEAI